MNADDDWFVQPKRIMRMIWSPDDDIKLLVIKWFVLPFADGIIVITHWKVNNNEIRSDRYKPTIYKNHLKRMTQVDKVYALDLERIPIDWQSVNQMEAQSRIEESRIEENKKENIKEKKSDDWSPKQEEIKVDKKDLKAAPAFADLPETPHVKLTNSQIDDLNRWFGGDKVDDKIRALENYIVNGKGEKYKDHYLTLLTRFRKEGLKPKNPPPIEQAEPVITDSFFTSLEQKLWQG